MATITPTVTNDTYATTVVWSSVTASDTCVGVSLYILPQWVWHVIDPGGGAAVQAQASNDNVTFPNGVALSSIDAYRIASKYIRPKVGSSVNPVTIILYASKTA